MRCKAANLSVSVVMTCHNEERFIKQAVRSVVAQTAYDLVCEIVVVNDGSRDGSAAVLDQLSHEIEKLRIIETPGLGLSSARNRALQEATGEFIAILDGDDYWEPKKLARQMPAFASNSRTGLVYSDFVDFVRDDAADAHMITVRRFVPDHSDHLRDYFVNDAPIVPSTVVIRRAVVDNVGLFDESLRIGEDTEFCLRVAEKWRFCYVPGALTFKRRHAGQITSRLDKLLPIAALVTRRLCERCPDLQPLAKRRMARIHVKVAVDCALKGEWRNGIHHTVVALRLAPTYLRGWANLALFIAPTNVVRAVYRSIKTSWHTIRQTYSS